jgi:hypothetical protein
MPTVEAELRNAAEEFFKRTRAWREWLPDVIPGEGVRQVDITPPAGSYVVQIEKATRNGNPIPVEGAFSLTTPAPLQNIGGVSSMDRRKLDVLSDGFGGDSLRLQTSLAPTEMSTGLPDHLAEQYGREITDGAVFRIRSLPLLADAALASVAYEQFEGHVARVGALVHRTHTSTTPRLRPMWC